MYYNICGDVCITPKSYSIAIAISMTSNQSLASLSSRIETILSQLQQVYPNATYELDWETPLELLVATILAAQCTDERVNQVTKTLFPKYPNAAAYAAAELAELEQDLMKLVPQSEWIFFGPAMVLHGRYTCTASNPQCSQCKLFDVCEQKI